MQDLDADALFAIFKSMPSTDDNLQQAHMWSKSNHAFKDAFALLLRDKVWMQPIRFKVEFLKKVDSILLYAVPLHLHWSERSQIDVAGKPVSMLDMQHILAGIEIYNTNIEMLEKISELVEKITCQSLTAFSGDNSNLIGQLGGIKEFVSILQRYPAPQKSDYMTKLPQVELHKTTCTALNNLISHSDQNSQIFININGIESLAHIDELGGQYYNIEYCTPSYIAALWKVLPGFGWGGLNMALSNTNTLKNMETKERIKKAYCQSWH